MNWKRSGSPPLNGEFVLTILTDGSYCIARHLYRDDAFEWYDDEWAAVNVTYWMPLPKPPTLIEQAPEVGT